MTVIFLLLSKVIVRSTSVVAFSGQPRKNIAELAFPVSSTVCHFLLFPTLHFLANEKLQEPGNRRRIRRICLCKANYIFQCLLNSLTHKWRRISAPIKSAAQKQEKQKLFFVQKQENATKKTWRGGPLRLAWSRERLKGIPLKGRDGGSRSGKMRRRHWSLRCTAARGSRPLVQGKT